MALLLGIMGLEMSGLAFAEIKHPYPIKKLSWN
jgi:hypothetical protein